MEGPSVHLAANQLAEFRGKIILAVSGNTRIGKERLLGEQVQDLFAWGKHLVIQLEDFALRTHFMLFGSFEATSNGESLTGDYRRAREPRLQLTCENGDIKLFSCSVKFVETPAARDVYDFSVDIMAPEWDAGQAFSAARARDSSDIADVLLDQDVFAGVGNIIKNEALWRSFVHPEEKAAAIPDSRLRELIDETRHFSHQFFVWRKQFALRKHLDIYQKAACPRCGGKVLRRKTGARQRQSHYCPNCQRLGGDRNSPIIETELVRWTDPVEEAGNRP